MTTKDGSETNECPRLRPVEAFPAVVSGKEVLCLRDPQHYSEAVVYLPIHTASILGMFDGQHSLLDIQEAYVRRFGTLLFREELLEVIRSLQAVFLRHRAPSGSRVWIVPILCGSFDRFVEGRRSPREDGETEAFIAALRDAMTTMAGRSVVIASADLAHVGPRFGDPRRITPGQLREVADADRGMLAAVEGGDAEAFFHVVARDGDRRRICGLPPIYTMMRILPQGWGRLLRYGQWPDPQGTVTFASVAMYS